jgi:hypothetical protein
MRSDTLGAQDGVIAKPVNKVATFEPNVGAHIAPPHAEGNEAKLLDHDAGVRGRLRQNVAKSHC